MFKKRRQQSRSEPSHRENGQLARQKPRRVHRGGGGRGLRGNQARQGWFKRRRGAINSTPAPNDVEVCDEVQQAEIAPVTATAPWSAECDWGAEGDKDGWWNVGPGAPEVEEAKPAVEAAEKSRDKGPKKPFEQNQWKMSKDNQEFFGGIFKVTEKDMEDQRTGWWQGKPGNCATVGVSKAAMDAYGTKVFKSMEPHADGLRVQLHNGETASLTVEELALARKMAKYQGTNENTKAYAVVMYAVIAKQALKAKLDKVKTLEEAMTALNDGQWPPELAGFLGLGEFFKSVNVLNLDGKDAVCATSPLHSVYVDKTADGHVADQHGSSRQYNGTDTFAAKRKRVRSKYTRAITGAWGFTDMKTGK